MIWFILLIIFIFLRYFYFKLLTDEQKGHFYRLMNRVDRLCNDHDIPYFIICGTLLGSIRHKKMIPWDNDIDIGIMKKDLEKLKSLDLQSYGIESGNLDENHIGKLFFPEHYENGEKFESVFVDVFVFEEVDGKIQYTSDFAKKTWPKEYFYPDDLFPLRPYKFGNMTVSGPANYEKYATRVWGDWTSYPWMTYLHVIFHPEKIEWIL